MHVKFLTLGLTLAIGTLGGLLASGCSGDPDDPGTSPTPGDLRVVFYHPLGQYEGLGMTVSGDSPDAGSTITPSGSEACGTYFDLSLADNPQSLSFSIARDGTDELGGTVSLSKLEKGKTLYVFAGKPQAYEEKPVCPGTDEAIIYYVRPQGDYTDWGLHTWNGAEETQWTSPLPITGQDSYGAYWKVALFPDATKLGFIIHQGDTKDPGPDQFLIPAEHGYRIWRLQGDPTLYTYPVDADMGPRIDGIRAHFLDTKTLAWELGSSPSAYEGHTFKLFSSRTASIELIDGKLIGGDEINVTLNAEGLSEALQEKYPHLANYEAFSLPSLSEEEVKALVQGQLVLARFDAEGTLTDATQLQLPGVLDTLFVYEGPLGPTFTEDAVSVHLWAPTAQAVGLEIYDDATSTSFETVTLTADEGVWHAQGPSSWRGKYYRYVVLVYAPTTGKLETNHVTDPYATGLSLNSQRSQFLDLADPLHFPEGWTEANAPEGAFNPVVYELHVRDFSASDVSVPEELRGTFQAFALEESAGRAHLEALHAAGLTHVHLLPSFDIATIEEDRSLWDDPGELTGYGPAGEEQQAAIAAIQDTDGYNWGYDPYHYNVPEGSYATDPDGPARTVEFRNMVQALHGIGLRVVMDVVYNHTNASGQADKSVLDKVVPGYYHRLDTNGNVATSTCCQNTATEHAMMERLMIDSLVQWARAYKVDGFRFDLMGHHMKQNMLNARAALDALTLEKDGVDGRQILMYGEGWDFGEVANNARGVNATQLNMAGTGIGTFNDRLRDAVRGGGPFDSGEALQKQGFASGLYVEPNDYDQGSESDQLAKLLLLQDQIRVGLTGNLANYEFEGRIDQTVKGSEVEYNGAPCGYTLAPKEAINYVEAHDNQTFFDILQYKLAPAVTAEDRVRAQVLGLSTVLLSQGIPFVHAGQELLRSKSLDRDSYNSGDWFNRLDFTYQDNHFGMGLPMEEVNGTNWPLMIPLLEDETRKPAPKEILDTATRMMELLQVRASSPLFALQTEAEVQARLFFDNTGSKQVPGLIVMTLRDDVEGSTDLDSTYERLVVLFNGSPEPVSYTLEALTSGHTLELHPVQAAGNDTVVKTSSFDAGTFTVPGRSVAVFVEYEQR